MQVQGTSPYYIITGSLTIINPHSLCYLSPVIEVCASLGELTGDKNGGLWSPDLGVTADTTGDLVSPPCGVIGEDGVVSVGVSILEKAGWCSLSHVLPGNS